MNSIRIIVLAIIPIGIILSCSSPQNDKKTETEPTEDIQVEDEVKDLQAIEVPFVDRYPEDWEGIKYSILTKDKDSIGTWCTIYGIDKESLLSLTADKDITKALEESSFEDLVPEQMGDEVYLRFDAKGSDGKILVLYITPGSYQLMIEFFIIGL